MFLDLKTARKLLGNDAIIGVTVASIEEAMIACEDGADYLGIGTIFATPTYLSLSLVSFLIMYHVSLNAHGWRFSTPYRFLFA